jgi:hypothetical protein
MLPKLLIIPAALAAVAIAGCDINDDGPRTTQTRDVAAFTRLDNPDSVDVRLHVGEAQKVQVRAGKNVIDDVRTEVHDGALRVKYDHHFFGDSVDVEVWVPTLTGIDASGSGDIDADGIDADAFELSSDGSADITLAGAFKSLDLSVDGSGDADLGQLKATDARVSATGSGDIDVNADKRLDVNMDGSGDVRYTGNPQLTKHDDGSGDLTHSS